MTDNFEKKVAACGKCGRAWLVHVFPRRFAGRPALGQRWTVARKREVVLGSTARGPKPAISLLVAEADLESPWEGEGYRKVWARLRVCREGCPHGCSA